MKTLTNSTPRVPRCGKAIRNCGGIHFRHFITALLLCAVFFAWPMCRTLQAEVSGNQSLPVVRIPPGVMDYIISPQADKSCGVCLTAATDFLDNKKMAGLREKVKDMALLRGGEYLTGSPEGLGEPDEHPQRLTYLNAFYIEKHEVTIAEYMKFATDTGDNYPEWARPAGNFNIDTGRDPYYKGLAAILKTCETCPIVGVSAINAEAYCRSINRRLPTEAEWEAAARGGADTAFSFGDSPAMAGDYAWDETNSGERPRPVGGKRPNKYGLYDMHGNVWEWVSDFYSKDYYDKSPKRNPKGPAIGRDHVIRGGSWAFDTDSLRSANRASTAKTNDDIGFRCAVSESAF